MYSALSLLDCPYHRSLEAMQYSTVHVPCHVFRGLTIYSCFLQPPLDVHHYSKKKKSDRGFNSFLNYPKSKMSLDIL